MTNLPNQAGSGKRFMPGDEIEAQSVYRARQDEWLPGWIVGPAASYAKRKLFRVLIRQPSGLIGKALRSASEIRPRQRKGGAR